MWFRCVLLAAAALLVCEASGRANSKFMTGVGQFIPRTVWCGSGNRATRYDHLGLDRVLDSCCRDHDHCPNYIPAATYNSTFLYENKDDYPMFDCECECRFDKCIQEAQDGWLWRIVYFHVHSPNCFIYRPISEDSFFWDVIKSRNADSYC